MSEITSLTRVTFPLLEGGGKILVLKKILSVGEEVGAAGRQLAKSGGKVKAVFHVASSGEGRAILLLRNRKAP